MAIDTTLVSILLCTAAPGGNDGAALEVAKRRKERAPELVGEGGLARWVVVGGRNCHFPRSLGQDACRVLIHFRAGSKPR